MALSNLCSFIDFLFPDPLSNKCINTTTLLALSRVVGAIVSGANHLQ